MATPEEIEAVKDTLPADAVDYGWDDDRISQAIDEGLAGNALFLAYWDRVTTSTAYLVDMSESGSSRSLSQVHKNAASLAKMYRDLLDKDTNPPSDRTRGIRSGVIRRV